MRNVAMQVIGDTYAVYRLEEGGRIAREHPRPTVGEEALYEPYALVGEEQPLLPGGRDL